MNVQEAIKNFSTGIKIKYTGEPVAGGEDIEAVDGIICR